MTPVTSTKVLTIEPLALQDMRELLSSKGPCLTLVLPAYRPGERAKSSSVLLKAQLQEAAHQLAERGVAGSVVDQLLAPLQSYANDPVQLGGSHWGRAIIRSTSVLRQFRLTQPVSASVSVGNCFAIRPLLTELNLPPEFYLLMLSKNRVDLLHCGHHGVVKMELPNHIPATLNDFLQLEPPDHDLENRSASGADTGAMRAVRFGTGSERETKHAHSGDYYRAVDRGLHKLLGEERIPLMLAGVDEDSAIYRSVSEYPSLLRDSLHRSGEESLQEADLLRDGYAIIRVEAIERETKALTSAKERLAPSRFSTDPVTVLRAAFEGRVHRLYIDEDGSRPSTFENAVYQSLGEEDLMNLAAVQTILHAGLVFTAPDEKMPENAALAAEFRF